MSKLILNQQCEFYTGFSLVSKTGSGGTLGRTRQPTPDSGSADLSGGGGRKTYQQVVGPDLPGGVQRCLPELQDVLVAQVVPVLRPRLV